MKASWFVTALSASRWLLTPFYLALIVALLALIGKDAKYAYELAIGFWLMDSDEVILAALRLVDLTLTASLVVLVVFSGYANFISRVDVEGHAGWPKWMADIDFSELEIKLIASVVAISGIKLLEAYMDLDHESDRDLAWQAGLFGVFVVALLLVAIADAAQRRFDRPH